MTPPAIAPALVLEEEFDEGDVDVDADVDVEADELDPTI